MRLSEPAARSATPAKAAPARTIAEARAIPSPCRSVKKRSASTRSARVASISTSSIGQQRGRDGIEDDREFLTGLMLLLADCPVLPVNRDHLPARKAQQVLRVSADVDDLFQPPREPVPARDLAPGQIAEQRDFL